MKPKTQPRQMSPALTAPQCLRLRQESSQRAQQTSAGSAEFQRPAVQLPYSLIHQEIKENGFLRYVLRVSQRSTQILMRSSLLTPCNLVVPYHHPSTSSG